MTELRQGECPNCPHDIVDSRDLKLYRNVCGFSFPTAADRFAWRDRLPFARQGLVEVVIAGGGMLLLAIGLAFLAPWFALAPAVLALFYFWFFRDPERSPPTAPGLVVAPCDGVVDDICEVEDCPPLGAPALRIGISLSLFDVHLNRCPLDAVVTQTHYHRGEFKNAQRKGDHSNNEQFWTVFAPTVSIGAAPNLPPLAVRQIAGPIARTIVNEVRPGQHLARGERFGMIKFGSRTELYFALPATAVAEPAPYRVTIGLGARVLGGVTALLQHETSPRPSPSVDTTARVSAADAEND